MDDAKASYLENELQGKFIDSWEIVHLLDHGKSAAVFLARRNDENYALKVFDNDLVVKYGGSTQIERIQRELGLVGKKHPNLVEIVGGGFDSTTNNHYIVMEYLPYPNLKKILSEINTEDIALYIDQLAEAALFLEEHGLVHRDIKPENIAISIEQKKLVLLDLGVMRPIEGSDVTDFGHIHPFVGTLQYSPPEFLLRQEEKTTEGYRAISFYQIGAVLHDLIMQRRLFSEFETPYPRLVNAIQHQIPEIQNEHVSSALVDLAKCCLLKNPRDRLSLVNWEHFKLKEKQYSRTAKQRVTTRVLLARAEDSTEQSRGKDEVDTTQAANDLRHETVDYLKGAIKAFKTDNSMFPLCTVHKKNDNLIITFDASKEAKLIRPIEFQLALEILDPKAKAIRINGLKYSGEKEVQSVIFAGIFDAKNIYHALEEYTYQVLDEEQQ